MKKTLLTLAALTLFTLPANAAFIIWDDSDPLTITITAGDFEGGFFVDGNFLTSGVGNSGSVTLPDAGHSFSGSWIDLGAANGVFAEILFALPGDPSAVTSGMTFGVISQGGVAAFDLSAGFGGYNGLPYFGTLDPTFLQNGQTVVGDVPFLTYSFTSEAAAVPEPGTMLLLGSGLLGLAARRRRMLP